MIGKRRKRTGGASNIKSLETTNVIVPLDVITSSINGRTWKTDYFLKNTTIDESVLPFDLLDVGNVQDYTHFKDKVLYIQTELPVDGDLTSLQGSVLVEGIVPTEADVFVAGLDGGGYGVFTPHNIKKETYRNESIFSFDFSILKILNTQEQIDEFYNILKDGSVETLVEVSGDGRLTSAYLQENDMEQYRNLQQYFNLISKLIIEKHEKGDFKLPFHRNQDGNMLYDCHIQSFIHKLVNFTEFNTDEIFKIGDDSKDISILDVLFNKKLKGRMKFFNITSEFGFTPQSEIENVIDTFIFDSAVLVDKISFQEESYNFLFTSTETEGFPKLFTETYIFSPTFYSLIPVDETVRISAYASVEEQLAFDMDAKIADYKTNNPNPKEQSRRLLNPVNVLPATGLSTLELEVLSYLREGKTDKTKLLTLAEDLVSSLNDTEVVYFGSILLFLIKSNLHEVNMFSHRS